MAGPLHADIEDIVECTICLDPMVDPKMLDCRHSFCYNCLEPLVFNGKISCPTCRSIMPIPSGGICDLPNDFTINKLTDAVARMGPIRQTFICATCPESRNDHLKLEWFCKDCKDVMCENCASTHKSTLVFADHELVKTEKCSEHPEKDQVYICTKCQVLICNLCVVIKHKSHPVDQIKKYLATRRQELAQLILSMKSGYCKSVADSVSKVDIQSTEVSVRETLAKMQEEIDEVANRNISKIKQEHIALTTTVRRRKEDFESWVGAIKAAKLLITNVEELTSNGEACVTSTASGKEALDEYSRVSNSVKTTIDNIASNAQILSSFSSMVIPTDFSALNAEVTLGIINSSAEIQSGLTFSAFSRKPTQPDQGHALSEPTVGASSQEEPMTGADSDPTSDGTSTRRPVGTESHPMSERSSARRPVGAENHPKSDRASARRPVGAESRPTSDRASTRRPVGAESRPTSDRAPARRPVGAENHPTSDRASARRPIGAEGHPTSDGASAQRPVGAESNPISDGPSTQSPTQSRVVECEQQSESRNLSLEQIKLKLDQMTGCTYLTNDKIIEWIQANVGGQCEKVEFIHALMTCVCRIAIQETGGSPKLNEDLFMLRLALLKEYIGRRFLFQVQALYALSIFVQKLGHPAGLLHYLFRILYKEKIISKNAFMEWKATWFNAEGLEALLEMSNFLANLFKEPLRPGE